MSIKLVTIKGTSIAEIIAATGSEQLIDKTTQRNFVGLYDEDTNWYIPLRANLGKKKPQGAVFDTPFPTTNPHFKRPGLDFQKALYIEEEGVLPIRNTLPKAQSNFIEIHQKEITLAFELYLMKVAKHQMSENQYFMSTPTLFPEGIEKIRKKYEREAPTVKKAAPIPKATVDEAQHTSILTYALSKGMDVKTTSNGGGKEYAIRGTNIKWSGSKNLFRDYSGNTKGSQAKEYGGVINFAMYMNTMSFRQAVKDVLTTTGAGTYQFNEQRDPFVFPKEIMDQGFESALSYLVKERGLDEAFVSSLFEQGLLTQTKNKEVGFVWRDDTGAPVGLTLQGTKPLDYQKEIKETGLGDLIPEFSWKVGIGQYGLKTHPLECGKAETRALAEDKATKVIESARPFKKQIWKNPEPYQGFNFTQAPKGMEEGLQKEVKLIVAESPIDLMSFAQLHENEKSGKCYYQSLEGLKEGILNHTIERIKRVEGQAPDAIVLAVDNDEVGTKFAQKWRDSSAAKAFESHGGSVVRKIPKSGKDWNDKLRSQEDEGEAPNATPAKPSPFNQNHFNRFGKSRER